MTVKIGSLFAPDNPANNPSTVEKPPNITSAFPTANLQSVNRLTERIASSKDINNLPGGGKNYAASPLDQNNPARQTDAPTEIVQTFKTNGGSWRTRNNVENDTPRFYRDGEDTSGTTRFDKEFYTDKNTNQWVRLNANGRAADAPEFKGKQKPKGVSDFAWKGWEEVAAAAVPGEYTTEGKTISFTDAANADNANTVLRRYIQQNVIGDGWTGDVGTDEQAVARAAGLGVKVQAEPTGKDADGKTVFRVKISDEDLAKLRQVKAGWTTQKAGQAQKTAAARNETNQKFLDLPRVLWNSTVNVAEGTVNTVLDAARTNGGQTPLALLDPTRPQVDFSGAKTDYRSEMMRRDLEGKLDGEGLKRGEFTEAGVTIVAPLVVGKVATPKVAPQSLKNLGGFPEFVVKQPKWNYFFGRGVKPNSHNTPRSLQNKIDLEKLRIFDDAQGQQKLLDIFEEGLRSPIKDIHKTEWGTTITKHIKVSETGGIDVKYFYPSGNRLAKPQISSIIPKIYKLN